jgi:ABC-2 type transport system ATP-binding protein
VDTIVAEQLRKHYGSVRALESVSFAVAEGEVFALLGPNGAGKSTTVRVLTTLTRPDSGRGFVAGHDVLKHPQRARRAFGYVPQESGVDREATGRENLMLQGRIHGMRGTELRARVDELLCLVAIEDAADRIVSGYSGGMKRRLDIALGLVHRPTVLFLDEPTTGLDPEARVAMWDEVQRLARQETLTILLTTHYLEEADQLADRVAIVSRGQVVVDGHPDELKRALHGDSIAVEVHDGAVERAADLVRNFDGASEVTTDGRVVRARVPNGAQAVPAVLSSLEAIGVEVAAVTTAHASLDDVYLHYTGRAFATEDGEGAG